MFIINNRAPTFVDNLTALARAVCKKTRNAPFVMPNLAPGEYTYNLITLPCAWANGLLKGDYSELDAHQRTLCQSAVAYLAKHGYRVAGIMETRVTRAQPGYDYVLIKE